MIYVAACELPVEMGARLHYRGLVIAVLGFVLTRFTVSLALYDDPLQFLVAGIVPLVLGLGLSAFGVSLVVADVDRELVVHTVRWCLIGTGTMLVLVILTLVGSSSGGLPTLDGMRSQLYLSNFLIGGSIGGTLTGLYSARTSRQRTELQQQANRLEVLNRKLRHEVLNAVTIIQGYASVDQQANPDAPTIIRERSHDIADTIDWVRFLAQRTTDSDRHLGTVDLPVILNASVQAVRATYPEADITLDLPAELPAVEANERLEQVFVDLLENAVAHANSQTPRVVVDVESTATAVSVQVQDDGPGLPVAQQELLKRGDITEFDDPRDGYGLNVVRLLIEHFAGRIDTDVTDAGTTVTVTLNRADAPRRPVDASRTGLAGVRLDGPQLLVTLAASILAGVVYGLVSQSIGGSVAAIGVFYGIADPVVGWITHEFHSAVFGFMFAGIVSSLPDRYRNRTGVHLLAGAGWGLTLWFVAASIVAPIWLRLLGIDAPLPNFSMAFLLNHLVWGLTLGAITAVGYQYVSR